MTPPPQPTSTTDAPASSLATTPSNAGSTVDVRASRDHASQTSGCVWALFLVGDTNAGAERVGDLFEHCRLDATSECTNSERDRVLFVSKHCCLHLGELEAAVIMAFNETRCGLSKKPFTNEPFV
jgi:hypothetical protein